MIIAQENNATNHILNEYSLANIHVYTFIFTNSSYLYILQDQFDASAKDKSF